MPAAEVDEAVDLLVRPKLVWRVVFPVAAFGAVLLAVLEPSIGTVAFGIVMVAHAVSAWTSAIVVIEPTVLQRTAWGRWRELHLDRLVAIHMHRDVRVPTLGLQLIDADGGALQLNSRAWWDGWGWRQLYDVLGPWVRRAAAQPTFSVWGRRATRRHFGI